MKDGVKPYAIHVPRPIPIHQQQQVKEYIEKMIDLGVIQEAIGPTEYCSPMVTAMKGNGKIRIYTDMTNLNLSVKREVHPMATVAVSLSRIKGPIFRKLYANFGFWQIPLDKNNWELTTLITPWGIYYYRKLPFGLTSAPEVFCKEITNIIGDCKGIIVHVDDILVMGASQEEHDENINEILNRVEQAGMTLNKKKWIIGME